MFAFLFFLLFLVTYLQGYYDKYALKEGLAALILPFQITNVKFWIEQMRYTHLNVYSV